MAKYTITNKDKKVVTSKNFNYLPNLTDELDILHESEMRMSDIFQITLWKINRYPQIDKDKENEDEFPILTKLNSLRKLKRFDEDKTTEILTLMLHTHGIGLAMASTYLRFTNPKVFPIIDTRALRAAFDYDNIVTEKEKLLSAHWDSEELYQRQIALYLEYVDKVNDIAQNGYHGLFVKFENLDRFLYEIDADAGFELKEKKPFNPDKIDNWKKKIREYGGEIK